MRAILHILSDFINLIYPDCCAVCDEKLVFGEKMFCAYCLADMPKTRIDNFTENPVAEMFWGKVRVKAATSLFFFAKGSKYRKLLHKLKYKGQKEIGTELGRILGNEIKGSVFDKTECIVPVPLHHRRLRSRGYNQSEYIARGIADVLQKPVYTEAIRRVVFSISQTGKGRWDRWHNVEDIFETKSVDILKNKKVLFVDDIITTGSTMEACINAVTRKVNCEVYVAALAFTR